MRTIASLPEFKQRRIAQETLDIYAPLSHRLGIADMKWQLEDTSFAVLYPLRYAEIEQMVATQAPEREEFLHAVLTELLQALEPGSSVALPEGVRLELEKIEGRGGAAHLLDLVAQIKVRTCF